MKYYLIVGEASGDLHASRLMQSIKVVDAEARFRFFGGDLMSAVGGTRIRHYKELAYMGFLPVLLHLPTIFSNMKRCKRDIAEWAPDAVILVDYPGFNLSIARYISQQLRRKGRSDEKSAPRCYYYISPKLWAWKEYRIKNIRRDVDELFSILPFEVDFFEQKHHYPIHYVGNPTAHEVSEFLASYDESTETFALRNGLDADKPIIALLAGSRLQEIKDNLPTMLKAAEPFAGRYQLVLAGAPAIDDSYYEQYMGQAPVTLVRQQTYPLLAHSVAALVTSGTATLETALFRVPQVVCYKTPVPRLTRWAFTHLMGCRYISLVNLVADREVVPELFAERFTTETICQELEKLLPTEGIPTVDSPRDRMLAGYEEVAKRLGTEVAPDNAARLMVSLLQAKA